jgi:hypothetical protein
MVPRFAMRHRKIRARADWPCLNARSDGRALQTSFVGSILEIAGIEAILA